MDRRTFETVIRAMCLFISGKIFTLDEESDGGGVVIVPSIEWNEIPRHKFEIQIVTEQLIQRNIFGPK